jgi:glycosyltransferase involved in cell wall biosynthesis
MKIHILSDARLETSAKAPYHGLGKVVLTIANGLADCGHEITLYAAPGSEFERGKLVTDTDERRFIPRGEFDAILDSTHQHTLQYHPAFKAAKILNLSQDREATPGRNAVFSSHAHRIWHMYRENGAKVVHNGVNVPEAFPSVKNAPSASYFAYLSMFHTPKAPLMAAEVARLAKVNLVMAGPTSHRITPPPHAKYIGPLTGEDKDYFLANAKALLFLASTEAGPVTPLEAQALGCPVIVLDHGASKENMCDGLTGFVVRDTLEAVEAVGKIDTISRDACRQWIRENRSIERMVSQYEQAVVELVKGEGWGDSPMPPLKAAA